ncbi:hypothetical protein [Pseudomonas sp. EL_65y_Pfl2_R96]|uniref:hypothetical protein n=1 Tax=Pseudomonas sp. EL_65y_Pfl2_R96 TaxID=3088699 RepID=UPI0030D996FF
MNVYRLLIHSTLLLYLQFGGIAQAVTGPQHDYFRATGTWQPALRLDLGDTGQRIFGFNQQDQLYFGYQVASRLNARFRDTAITCRDGSAAFHCNGVLIRGTAASTQFHAWNPSPNSVGRNGVSFSWARATVGMLQIAGNQRLIFKESAAAIRTVPIVRVALNAPGANVFFYEPSDQST